MWNTVKVSFVMFSTLQWFQLKLNWYFFEIKLNTFPWLLGYILCKNTHKHFQGIQAVSAISLFKINTKTSAHFTAKQQDKVMGLQPDKGN